MAPATLLATPGEKVCLTGSTDAAGAQFRWFYNGGEILSETNASLCLRADWDTEAVYSVAAITDQGIFLSSGADLRVRRPYIYPLTKDEQGQYEVLWLGVIGNPEALQSSTNLMDWVVLTNWSPNYSSPLRVTPPNSGGAQFFRIVPGN